jgi:hypothetical protein
VVDNLNLRFVQRRDLDEHILRFQCDLAVIAVDDGWQREDSPVRVIDDRVDWRVADDVQESAEMLVFLRAVRTNGLHTTQRPTYVVELH